MQKSSTLDYPGLLSCVLFTWGCNLNCFYCHNRDLISGSGADLLLDGIFSFLKRRQGLLDGVVISGGEPTLQPDLTEFIEQIKSMGFLVKLDTNGQRIEPVRELLSRRLIDYAAVDWKAPRDEYASVCGVPGYDKAKETILLLAGSGIPFEARTTLYPGLSKDQLISLMADLPPLPRYRLNFYQVPIKYRNEDAERIFSKGLSESAIRSMETELRKYQPNLEY